jgi:alkylation response protein AidB-like acyl-CoA dehydrogenase
MTYDTFGFTEQQVLMRDGILKLVDKVYPPEKIRHDEATSSFPFEATRALADAGWYGLPIAEEYGGTAAGYADMAVFIEALSYRHKGLSTAYICTVIYGGMMLQKAAREEIRREFLPKIVNGDIRMAISYTEPSSGSDAAGIRTRARKAEGGYTLQGQKIYSTAAHVADYLVVSAKTDPDKGAKGLSLFLVDTRSPGVTIRPMDPLGCRTTLINEVFLDEVPVPAEHLLGEENGGWKLLMHGLNFERLLLAAAASGQAMNILEITRTYALERYAFGKRITEFQAVAHKLAEMRMLTETNRLHCHRVAAMLDAGRDAIIETAIAKTVTNENLCRIADLGLSIFAAAGFVAGDMQRLFRDSRIGFIGGGTAEIMRNVIARQMGVT